MPLEFYGYAYARDATPQLAFLRQGPRIIIAAEGDLIEDTYRLLRVTADSAVVEDVSNRRRQTLPLLAPRPHIDSAEVQPAPSVVRPRNTRNVAPAAKASQPSR